METRLIKFQAERCTFFCSSKTSTIPLLQFYESIFFLWNPKIPLFLSSKISLFQARFSVFFFYSLGASTRVLPDSNLHDKTQLKTNQRLERGNFFHKEKNVRVFFFLKVGCFYTGSIDPRRIAFYFAAPSRFSYLISDRLHPRQFPPRYIEY